MSLRRRFAAVRRRLCTLAVVLAAACAEEPPPGPVPGELDFAAGQEAMRAGQYAVAQDLFQRAYVRGADPHQSLLWQIRADLALGHVEPARASLLRLLDLAPDNAAARALLVRLSLLLGEYEDAWKHRKLLPPADPAAALTDAEFALGLGLGSRAEQAVRTGQSTFPDRPEWPYHQAKADLLRGWLRSARGAYVAAAQTQRTGLGHTREAWFFSLLGERDRAERAYLDAAVHAEHDALPFSLSSDFYAAAGRFDEAVTDLANLERVLGRGSPDLTRRVSGLFVRSGRLAEAEGLMKPYLQRRVEDRTAARELALSYLLGGKDAEAVATLEVLALKDRDSAPTLYLTGAARLRSGDTTRARTAFQEAERRGAGDRLPVSLGLAAAALRTHDWFDAEFQARRRLEAAPDDWLAGLVWAAARKYQGQPAGARVLLERLVARFPERAAQLRASLTLPPPAPGEVPPDNLPVRLLDRYFGPLPASVTPPASPPASAP
jgi:tetratricopeptide (TPR) repeat protein